MTTHPTRTIASPENQKVTWIELFFDIVFVFSITQVVGVLHDGIDVLHAGRGLLVFWLVWWAWTQFTWALNAADTTHPFVELSTLAATGVAFFMAVTLPDAFGAGALWFALPYLLVRTIGLVLYFRVSSGDRKQQSAVSGFSLASSFGLLAVLAGALLGGDAQYWFWGAAIALDVIAALIGARSEHWNLHSEHFAERHGLIVIIALGETVIVAASNMTETEWTPLHVLVGLLGVLTTCALWWSYFTRAKHALDHAIEEVEGGEQSTLARDVFSLLHFPMVCGIIAYAAALDEVLAHPDAPLPAGARVALAVTMLAFVGGMSLAMRRARVDWPPFRIVAALLAAALLVALPDLEPALALAILLVAIVAVAWREHFVPRHVAHAPDQEPEQPAGTDPDDAVVVT